MEQLNFEFNKISINEKLGFKKQSKGFATKAIYAGQDPDNWKCKAIIPPIFTSVTYIQTVPRNKTDFFYGRERNPTRSVTEDCLAALENAKYALSFASGAGAMTTVLATLTKGDGLIASKFFYSGTLEIMTRAENMGFDVQYIDFTNLSNLKAAIKKNTKLVWTEPCMNPTMQVIDIKAVVDIVHSNSNAFVLVDSTFLTPYYHRPLELGADIVLHSLTKYFCGHSDVLGGSLAMNDENIYKTMQSSTTITGTMLSPFDAYLLNRSFKTMALRMEKHAENSYFVAKWLETHPKIGQVLHPALPSHPGHKIALKQSYGHSGIFSFHLKRDSFEDTKKFFESLKFIPIATSLGGVETTVSFPRDMSYDEYTDEEAKAVGVTNSLVRISVGIEEIEDIISDLKQALEQLDTDILPRKLSKDHPKDLEACIFKFF